ncbi:MAG: hydantoinase B/oxoprolinase family protein [Candidatus Auribacterota bacterium]|jgi:5-oxoprolinase (ATP-hydrolysing)|nr:hydantoinase B/oxoprolinase family protein [Candidatus Auribacterota bacterium]
MISGFGKWLFAVDRGGTFTDVVGLDEAGQFHALKLLSESPRYADASMEGIRRMLDLPLDCPLPEDRIGAIRFATTVATNALLERKGGRVALLITQGFADLLAIGYQNRPEIFALHIEKSPPLYDEVFEIDERIDANGKVVKPVDIEHLSSVISRLRAKRFKTIAVVCMHAWKNPAHEKIIEALLKDAGFSDIFTSHSCMNLIKIISRGQTTMVNAYLSTVMARYMINIQRQTKSIPVSFMTSGGSLCAPDCFTGKDALFSGPAGGCVAVCKIATDMNLAGAIGFDMGGTSTDVSRYDGEFERLHETMVEGIDIQNDMLRIISVASGGGSVLWFDGQKMRVGPRSAGANPGPACYGFGGHLCVTDANVITGRIVLDFFPKTFGKTGTDPINPAFSHRLFGEITEKINNATGTQMSIEQTATGFLRVVNEQMALAIKEISVSQGVDVRKYALVCFGGAGGQHACQIARLLDISTIVFHPLSSVMSAYGIGLARPTLKSMKTVLMPYTQKTHNQLATHFDTLLRDFSSETGRCVVVREVDLRPAGSNNFFTIAYITYEYTLEKCMEKFSSVYGFKPDADTVEVVNIRIEVQEVSCFFDRDYATVAGAQCTTADVSRIVFPLKQRLYYDDRWIEAAVYTRQSLFKAGEVQGPALYADSYSTFVIEPGFSAALSDSGMLVLKKTDQPVCTKQDSHSCDPVLLEVFNNSFSHIATQMGYTLKNTAHSVNIKERCDFSCALFDAQGGLVANAPHIPVHLGAMSDTVKSIREKYESSMRPGDMYISNNPYRGGSHLPDITVVCPVFSSDEKTILFYTASRGHHADIGGITPGSMPAQASHISEEGILIDADLIMRGGVFHKQLLLDTLKSSSHPARNLKERLCDIEAQIAACHIGVGELSRLIGAYGWDTVNRYMQYIQDNAAFCVRQALHRYINGSKHIVRRFTDYLDDGTPICVAITISAGSNPPDTIAVCVDFTGSGNQHESDNLNAPLAVTRSAVMYVLRTITAEDIPLNSGCMNPVELIVPEGCILNPTYPVAVASGNVETSQRVVDALLGAFGCAAASQGTMNNIIFAVDGEHPYYETIAGGSGAVEGRHGASGVQVHMTNTRMTDPEILEVRHQGVRLKNFSLRKKSGGDGLYRGGDGVVRELEFLNSATVSILTERRVYAPYGMHGGQPGKLGVNILVKSNGEQVTLPSRIVLRVNPSDILHIETPGGGGWKSCSD